MRSFLICIIAVLMFSACNKDQRYKTVYLNDDIKQKFFFKEGSFWIYKDSISGNIDSCYVKSSTLYMNKNEEKNEIFESLVVKLIQKPLDKSVQEFTILHLGFTNKNFIGDFEGSSNFEYFSSSYPIPKWQINENNVKTKYSSEIIPYYNVLSNSFVDVACIKVDFVPEYNFYQTLSQTCYFKDSIGYIKMKIYYKNKTGTIENKVYELQRYKIIL